MHYWKFCLTTILLFLYACTEKSAVTGGEDRQNHEPQPNSQQQPNSSNNGETPPATTTITESNNGSQSSSQNTSLGSNSGNSGNTPAGSIAPSTSGAAAAPLTPAAANSATSTGIIDIQGTAITFQDLKFNTPPGWKIYQDAFTDGTLIISFEKASDFFRLYARQGTIPSLQSMFANGSQITGPERDESIGTRIWKRIDTQRDQIAVAGFTLSFNGHAYYGFGRSGSTQGAIAVLSEFLAGMK